MTSTSDNAYRKRFHAFTHLMRMDQAVLEQLTVVALKRRYKLLMTVRNEINKTPYMRQRAVAEYGLKVWHLIDDKKDEIADLIRAKLDKPKTKSEVKYWALTPEGPKGPYRRQRDALEAANGHQTTS